MILTSAKIKEEFENEFITIDPFNRQQLGTVSYKFRVGNEIAIISNPLDTKKLSEFPINKIPKDGMVLYPGNLYLSNTYERLGSKKYVQKIFTTRKIANYGIFINVSANFGHNGANLSWTLEIVTCIPVQIYPKMIIGQITFWKTEGDKNFYDGKYSSPNFLEFSKIHKEI